MAELNISELILDVSSIELENPCLICGEGVPASPYGYAPKICEKCKAAVMKVRTEQE